MKNLLITSALIEIAAGIALLCFPLDAVSLVFGAPLTAPIALNVTRIAGISLLSLGLACWLTRTEEQSHAARGIICAMLLYNIGALIIFGIAGVYQMTIGIALWPAILLHAGMAAWCIAQLRLSIFDN